MGKVTLRAQHGEEEYVFSVLDCTSIQISQVFGVIDPFLVCADHSVCFAKGGQEVFPVVAGETYVVRTSQREKKDASTDTSEDVDTNQAPSKSRNVPQSPLPPDLPLRERGHSVSPEKRHPPGENRSPSKRKSLRQRSPLRILGGRDVQPGFELVARGRYVAADPSQLSLKRGDRIKVVAVHESGWWKGIVADKTGWFPSNYVDLVDKEEEGRKRAESDGKKKKKEMEDKRDVKRKNKEEEGRKRAESDGKKKKKEVEDKRLHADAKRKKEEGDKPKAKPRSTSDEQAEKDMVVAKSDWKATTEAQLSFSAGEKLLVMERHRNGWWLAARWGAKGDKKQQGWIPSNYIQ